MEAQLAEMEARLLEAEEKNQRAISMAQLTKRGHVYIISNVGSFGDNVYKIGLTRRLEPLDRVKELGDASVPFAFDVHAMIMSDDAPALERELHNHFLLKQINKVNHRKEFFRASLQEIREELESLGVETKWTMAAEAAEYRESLAIEKIIVENPEARAAWESRQLSLDPTEYADLDIE
ncbi:MAG: GIY-YIG nuclease family protein [Phycisphaerales bacterium]